MLLKIISRSLDADQAKRGRDVPESALRPASAVCLREVLRLIPGLSKPILPPGSESANRGKNEIFSATADVVALLDFHIPAENLFVRPLLPYKVSRDAVDIGEIIERNKQRLIHNEFARLL